MSHEARTAILDAFDDRIWGKFNATDGTVETVFRAHRVGPLTLPEVRPSYTVSDEGQRRASDADNESEGLILAVRVSLHVAATWEREATGRTWSDRVAKIDATLRGRPSGYGIEAIRFVRDEPVDIVFLSGDVAAVWVLDYEVHYFWDIDEFDNWNL